MKRRVSKSLAPVVLTFPMPTNIANARMHWRVKLNAKKAYMEGLDYLRAAKQIPPPPKQLLARVTVTSAMVLGGMMDHDNALHRHKWILDWLVTRGYLLGDSPDVLSWGGMPTQRVSRNERASITLTLEPR